MADRLAADPQDHLKLSQPKRHSDHDKDVGNVPPRSQANHQLAVFKGLPLKDLAGRYEDRQQQADNPNDAGTPQSGGVPAPFSRIQESQPDIEQGSRLDEFCRQDNPSPEQGLGFVQ